MIDGQGICSEPCVAGDPCPGAVENTSLTCREGDVCGPRCTFSGVQSEYLCESDGTVSACEDGNDVDDCGTCGCSYFGGGRCIAGMGCIDPLANGQSCTINSMCESNLCRPDTDTCTAPIANGLSCPSAAYCQSNLCRPDTNVCTAPLANGADCPGDAYCASGICGVAGQCLSPAALGAACREDRECASNHCSTDGDTTLTGTCQIPVGDSCGTTLSTTDPNCDMCRNVRSFVNLCFRENCNSTNATCPSGWRCSSTSDGGSACFQECDPNAPSNTCALSTADCRFDGMCSRTF